MRSDIPFCLLDQRQFRIYYLIILNHGLQCWVNLGLKALIRRKIPVWETSDVFLMKTCHVLGPTVAKSSFILQTKACIVFIFCQLYLLNRCNPCIVQWHLFNPFVHFASTWQHFDSKLLRRRICTSKKEEINGFLTGPVQSFYDV